MRSRQDRAVRGLGGLAGPPRTRARTPPQPRAPGTLWARLPASAAAEGTAASASPRESSRAPRPAPPCPRGPWWEGRSLASAPSPGSDAGSPVPTHRRNRRGRGLLGEEPRRPELGHAEAAPVPETASVCEILEGLGDSSEAEATAATRAAKPPAGRRGARPPGDRVSRAGEGHARWLRRHVSWIRGGRLCLCASPACTPTAHAQVGTHGGGQRGTGRAAGTGQRLAQRGVGRVGESRQRPALRGGRAPPAGGWAGPPFARPRFAPQRPPLWAPHRCPHGPCRDLGPPQCLGSLMLARQVIGCVAPAA